MLQHIPYGIYHGGKFLGFLVCLFVFGIYRRNVWMAVSSGVAAAATFLSWQYGYTLSPRIGKLTDVSILVFTPLAFVIFLWMMIQGSRKSSNQV